MGIIFILRVQVLKERVLAAAAIVPSRTSIPSLTRLLLRRANSERLRRAFRIGAAELVLVAGLKRGAKPQNGQGRVKGSVISWRSHLETERHEVLHGKGLPGAAS
jgi:hypothetical protein